MQSRSQKWASWHSQHSPGSTLQVYARVLMSLYAPRARGCPWRAEGVRSGVPGSCKLTDRNSGSRSQPGLLSARAVCPLNSWTISPFLSQHYFISVLITKELIVEYLLATWAKKVAWERLLLDYIGRQVTRAQLWVGNTRFGSSRNFICLHWGFASGN